MEDKTFRLCRLKRNRSEHVLHFYRPIFWLFSLYAFQFRRHNRLGWTCLSYSTFSHGIQLIVIAILTAYLRKENCEQKGIQRTKNEDFPTNRQKIRQLARFYSAFIRCMLYCNKVPLRYKGRLFLTHYI